jgi:hypothetical protein
MIRKTRQKGLKPNHWLGDYKTEQLKINLSSYLADDLGQDYSMLSKLFSEKGRQLPIILLLKKNVQKHYYFRDDAKWNCDSAKL